MPKVDFKAENFNRCLCPTCPVQAQSECVQERLQKGPGTLQGGAQVPEPETMAQLYCSIGKSGCEDLDGTQPCLCPGCPVWADYDLTSQYYCLRGNANQVDVG